MKQKLFAEFFGTLTILAAVTGSGIMGQNLAPHNPGLILLANAIATGCVLFVAISALAPISGAHFNPAVTLVNYFQKNFTTKETLLYISAQIFGGILGVILSNLMFNIPISQLSTKTRQGGNLWLSELIATLLLLAFIKLLEKSDKSKIPTAVALYITAAYWFTSSTSFANPAATIARMFSDTFVGISPVDVCFFISAQLVALAIFLAVTRALKNKPLN